MSTMPDSPEVAKALKGRGVPALFQEGASQEESAVQVHWGPGGLRIRRKDGSELKWPYRGLRFALGGARRGELLVRLPTGRLRFRESVWRWSMATGAPLAMRLRLLAWRNLAFWGRPRLSLASVACLVALSWGLGGQGLNSAWDSAQLASWQASWGLWRERAMPLTLKGYLGDRQAQVSLALQAMYPPEGGMNPAAGAGWLRWAAEGGDAHAQYLLAQLYLPGGGLKSDPGEAHRWLEKAAEAGHGQAQHRLAEWLLRQEGAKGRPEAIAWFKKAAAQHVPEAREALRRIGSGR